MSRFTPGEWTVVDRGGTRQAVVVQLPEHAYLDNVATAYAPRYGRYGEGEADKHLDEYEANANLIAAAPDLYRALQRASDWLSVADIPNGDEIVAQANAALRKAEGR